MIIVFETTLPALRMRIFEKGKSMGEDRFFVPRVTSSGEQVYRQISQGDTRRFGGTLALRISAWTLASSSEKAKGFVR